MKKKSKGKFLLGALVGTGLGMLFAPQKGSETRRLLKEKIDDLINRAKEIDVEEVRDTIEQKIKEIKTDLNDLDREKVLKIAKEKAKQIKEKSDELVDLAIKKGTPILKSAAEEVRETTITVVKEVLEKLEGKK